jgi:hypothetical protein
MFIFPQMVNYASKRANGARDERALPIPHLSRPLLQGARDEAVGTFLAKLRAESPENGDEHLRLDFDYFQHEVLGSTSISMASSSSTI